jgi:hypothetical protein
VTYGTDDQLKIELEATHTITYDLVHNRRPVIRRLRLTPPHGHQLTDVFVRVTLQDRDVPVSQTWERELPTLASEGEELHPDLILKPAAMVDIEEARPATIRVQVFAGGEEIATEDAEVLLLAHNQWAPSAESLAEGMALLAAHVQPNDPVIADVLSTARAWLGENTGSTSTEGYQSGPKRVRAIAHAVYAAIAEKHLAYSNPPASWEGRQKIRTHQQVLSENAATCLDSAVLYAAALEQAGINSLIWLPPGHALVGIWLDDEHALPAHAIADPELHGSVTSAAYNAVDAGLMLLIETTSLTRGASFEQALAEGTQAVNGAQDPILGVVDVQAARLRGIRPLPAAHRHADGRVEVHAYQPASINVSKPTFNQGSTDARPADNTPARIRQWKNTLLDLSLRNRLINFKRDRAAGLILPRSNDQLHPLDFIEDVLHEGRKISLVSANDHPALHAVRGTGAGLGEEDQQMLRETLAAQRRAHVPLDENKFQSTLRKLRIESRTSVQESGVNNLYLCLGTLVWEAADSRKSASSQRQSITSPLILVPVKLIGGTRNTAFQLMLDEAGASTPNYCLLEKLKVDYGLQIPALEVPLEDGAGVAVQDILQQVRLAISEAGVNMRVDETADLAILQFTKFRLWKDLDDNWQTFITNPLVNHLVHTPTEEFVPEVPEHSGSDLDQLAAACPIPADSTQLEAIQRAVGQETFVLEGPPGTGKSQTITNLLARAIAEGRKVLFVAEKRAALDVVQRRIDAIGLGPFCLDLHDKASKPALIRQQLLESLNYIPARDPAGVEAAHGNLRAAVTILSRYRDRLHETNQMGVSLYSAHDLLLAMGDGPSVEVPVEEIEGLDATTWQRIRNALPEYGAVLDDVHDLADNPWSFVGVVPVDSLDRAELAGRLAEVYRTLEQAQRTPFGRECLRLAFEGHDLQPIRQFIDAQPPTTAALEAVATQQWQQQTRAVVTQIQTYLADPLMQTVTPSAFLLPLTEIHQQALAADHSGFMGRKKKQRLILERLEPGLTTDVTTMDPATASSVAGTLVTLVGHLKDSLTRLAAHEGFHDVAMSNPLEPGFGADLQRRWEWLSWCADHVGRDWPLREACKLAASQAPVSGQGLDEAQRSRDTWMTMKSSLDAHDDRVDAWRGDAQWVEALNAHREALINDAENMRFRRLEEWLQAAGILDDLRAAGLDSVRSAIERGDVPLDRLQESVVRGVMQAAKTERAFATRLDAFDSDAHLRSVQRFSTSSDQLRERMTEEIPADLVRTRPFKAQSLAGEVGALQRELNRQRGGLSIREMLKRYGNVVTALTPCFLVSPDSVARFLEPGGIEFDVVVFDEASQIRVAEAIGPMGRAKAVVVVGDSRQMPPSTFAEASAASDEQEDSAEDVVADEESILSECVQARVPRQWLSWHYRSQDEALIAFSNRKYYDGRLSSFPAPRVDDKARSVSHVRVDGQFYRSGDRRTLRTNPVEAQAVVEDVIARFLEDPLASVGVVTFNIQQRDLITQLLSTCTCPAVVESIESDDADSLFVKNLENVQGDERDVIIFSLGFSKNERGILPLNFGPLNRQGGERRLNVAVTRARREVRVFSSFSAADIRLESTQSKGIRDLHDYLKLAEGTADSADLGGRHMPPDRHRDDVAAALRELGWPTTTEVGLSDFRIDISVGSREVPGRDLCAVLLDGPSWASRSTVGDRDGLPVSVLGGMLKWPAVHRIWLPDWLHERERVIEQLHAALTEADAALAEPDFEPVPSPVDQAREAVEATELSDFEMAVLKAHPVEVPRVIVDTPAQEAPAYAQPFTGWTSHEWLDRGMLDTLDRQQRAQIAAVLESGANAEGPIHIDRLVKLFADSLGIGRLRTERAETIRKLVPRHLPRTEKGTVVWPASASPEEYVTYRTSHPDERAFQQIPLIELGNAMVPLVEESMGLNRDELFRLTVREFHAERVTKQVRERLESALTEAVRRGRLAEEDGLVVRGERE